MDNFIRIILFWVIASGFSYVLAPLYIQILQRFRLAKQIRLEASLGGGKAKQFHKLHKHKSGTPTLGGGLIIVTVLLMIWLSIVLVSIGERIGIPLTNSLWNRKETYLVVFTLLSMGLLGGVDDYMNVRGIGKTKGMSARVKMIGLIFFWVLGSLWFFYKLGIDSVSLPYFGEIFIGWWYIPLFVFIIIAMTNSVNFADGLDGLVGGLLLQNFLLYACICYFEWLFLLSTVCITICGALVGFLWFNIKPAKFYMGDIGTLGLGGALGIMAMMTDTLVVLFLASLIYVFESLSVILQVGSKKLRNGRKIFRIAPFHHHLEAIGWSEETIVMRLWLIGGILNALGIVLYILINYGS